MNFFVNILWIFSYPNYSSKIGFMTQHYVLENVHAPFKFLPPQSQALIMTSPWFIVSESHSSTIRKYVLPHEFPSVQKHVLKGVQLKCMQFLSKAVATHALFYLHWQFVILKAVLQQKLKAVALVARYPQYLQHFAKSSIRSIFCNTVPAILLQNLRQATRMQHSGLTIHGTSERSVLPVK